MRTDSARAAIRLDMWEKELSVVRRPAALQARLKALDLSKDGFLDLLGERDEDLANRVSIAPHWLRDFSRLSNYSPELRQTHASTQEALASLILSFAENGSKELRSKIRRLDFDAEFRDGGLEDALATPPIEKLLTIVTPVLVLELNVARVKQCLKGETPEKRFLHFCRTLEKKTVRKAIFEEYPLLAREITTAVKFWVESRFEFAGRFLADRTAIGELLGDDRLHTPMTVEFGAGDTHRSGRSVAVIRFSNGKQIVYKPRDVAIDVAFAGLVDWINRQRCVPDLSTPRVIQRKSYGWVEYIDQSACRSTDEVKMYYKRLGALLATLYALCATDFHYENIIARGSMPILVDLEALFHPDDLYVEADSRFAKTSAQVMRESVMAVGLLPSPTFTQEPDDRSGTDLSGLSDAAGQLSPTSVPVWDNYGRDDMHLVRRRMPLRGGRNVPFLGANPVRPLDFESDVIWGFSTVYELFAKNKAFFLSNQSPLRSFQNCEIRVIVRPTRVYDELLREARHPDLMRNAIDRERFLCYLWGLEFAGSEEDRFSLISSELRQLNLGDIPHFVTRVDSNHVTDDESATVATLSKSGLSRSRSRISALSEKDKIRQTWFIHASLATIDMNSEPQWAGSSVLRASATNTLSSDCMAEAIAIGERLLGTMGHDEVPVWAGFSLINDRVWRLGMVGLSGYDGISGIAYFLGYLGLFTGQSKFLDAAKRVADLLVDEASRWIGAAPNQQAASGLGIGGGIGGALFVQAHLSNILSMPDLLEPFARAVPSLVSLSADDEALDFIGGSAGLIFSLLAADRASGNLLYRNSATTVARSLLQKQLRGVGEGGWLASVNLSGPLTGFAHGAAGIAAALAHVDPLPIAELRPAIDAALEFERRTFSPRDGSWPDLRVGTDGTDMRAWCHGAAGIGLSRLMLLGLGVGRSESLIEEVRLAAVAVVAGRYDGAVTIAGSGNHSLCHGDGGNLSFLERASVVLGDGELQISITDLKASYLKSVKERGPVSGVPLGVESPGLFSGLAGIGIALLGIAVGNSFLPSPILGEAPRT